jgi:single-strand DNA-binding protein
MINKVILVGNVGADPEIRTLETGTKVARVRLATTERVYNRQAQESKEYTEWHTVVLWSGLADVADKYVRKGSQLYIEGSLRTNEWTDKENVKRYTVEVIAREMKLLGRRSEGAGGSGGGSHGSGYSQGSGGSGGGSQSYGQGSASGSGYGHGQGGQGYGAGSHAAAAPASAPAPAPAPIPVDDPDDLPF